MKFAVDFNLGNIYLPEVDQIIIRWHPSHNLLSFLKEHANQRIIISIQDGKEFIDKHGLDMIQLISAAQNVNNWCLRLPNLFDNQKTLTNNQVAELKEKEVPFFFNTYCDKWELLYWLIELGVSDVYVTDQLAFDIVDVKKICEKASVNVRIIPNSAQSLYETNKLRTFFIRPEDLDDYDPYVDICEFYNINKDNPKSQEILYKIYKYDKRWAGDLGEIIYGLQGIELNSQFLHPSWVRRRIKCGKKCLRGDGCNMCEIMYGLMQSLRDAGVAVVRKENKEVTITQEQAQEISDKYL